MLICEACKFTCVLKGDYNRHIKTKKHELKIKELEKFEILQKFYIGYKDDEYIKNKKEIWDNELEKKDILICKYCSKNFINKVSKIRHELHICKKRYINIIGSEKILKEIEKIEEIKNKEIVKLEKDKLKNKKKIKKEEETINTQEKTIKKLNLENDLLNKELKKLKIENEKLKIENEKLKNNKLKDIKLNSYDEPDISYISNKYLKKMFERSSISPEQMIINITSQIYLNKKRPENNSICYPNINRKEIIVYSDKEKSFKRVSQNVIQECIDISFEIFKNYYEGNTQKLNIENHKISQIVYFIKKYENDNNYNKNNIYSKLENKMIKVLKNKRNLHILNLYKKSI